MSNPRDILRQLASFGTLDNPEVAARLSTGLTGFISRWERETLPFVAAGGAELRFVEAPYGRGKTHFLQALEMSAHRAGFVTARVQCGMQHKPFVALHETYRAVAATMSAALVESNGRSGLAGLIGRLSAEQLQAYQQATRGNHGFRNLVVAYGKRAQAGQLRDPVSADLCALLQHDAGRRVTFGELFDTARKMGVTLHRPLGRIGKRNAAVWLRSLLALPRQLGFIGLVVLFDETGSDLHLRPESLRSRQQHMANLRNLVDHLAIGGIPACSIVYATTNDFIQMAREDYPAMSQRVERLEESNPFASRSANPRAIWCRLDELTDPAPDQPEFFLELGERLLTLGKEAGVSADRLADARRKLPTLAEKMSQNLTQAAVREFIKRMMSDILRDT